MHSSNIYMCKVSARAQTPTKQQRKRNQKNGTSTEKKPKVALLLETTKTTWERTTYTLPPPEPITEQSLCARRPPSSKNHRPHQKAQHNQNGYRGRTAYEKTGGPSRAPKTNEIESQKTVSRRGSRAEPKGKTSPK